MSYGLKYVSNAHHTTKINASQHFRGLHVSVDTTTGDGAWFTIETVEV